ncbi:MAG TPA: DUF4339 domain-containing protein [Candidatus Methylacidiphilales bacterium]|nr:DUF4339 domain-containing protein [Candidatus Methylacidiphilales bacterium]
MSSEWYYAHNNEQKGPVNEAEIKELIATKVIPPDALVWKEGMGGEWLPANKIPDFTMRTPPKPAAAPAPVASAPLSSPVTPLAGSELSGIGSGYSSGSKIVTDDPPLYGFLYKPAALTPDPQDVEKNKIIAALAICTICVPLFWLPLVAAKDSTFAKYYANQGLTLTVAGLAFGVLMFIVQIVVGIIAQISPTLGLLGSCIVFVPAIGIMIAAVYIWVMGIIAVLNGKAKPLPFIGDYVLLK